MALKGLGWAGGTEVRAVQTDKRTGKRTDKRTDKRTGKKSPGLGAESRWRLDVGPGPKMAWGRMGAAVHMKAGWGEREAGIGHGEEGFLLCPWAGTVRAGVARGAVSCHTGTGRF